MTTQVFSEAVVKAVKNSLKGHYKAKNVGKIVIPSSGQESEFLHSQKSKTSYLEKKLTSVG